MATHDYVLANQSGSSFRTDLNNALAAVVTGNSSGTEPSTTYAYMEWNDTSNGVKKIRNAANNAWVELFQLDGTLTMEDGAEATPGLAFRDDLNTGIWSSGADALDISTGGTKRFTIDSSGDTYVLHNLYVKSATPRIYLLDTDNNSDYSIINNNGNFGIYDDTNSNYKLYITEAGRIGTEGGTTPACGDGGLDIRAVGNSNRGALTIGADGSGDATTRSSNTEKQYRIMMPNYSNATDMVTQIYASSGTGGHVMNYGGGTGWAYAVNEHNFYTTGNSTTPTGSLVLKLDSSKNVTVQDGDLVIGTAGHGIDFSATANGTGSSQSELFSDYESGVWTPTLETGTWSSVSGLYTRIGNKVFIRGWCYGPSDTSSSNDVKVTGLPFTGTNNEPAGTNISGSSGDFDKLYFQDGSGSPYLRFVENDGGGALHYMAHSDLGSTGGGAVAQLQFVGFYNTNA